jgi:5-methylcytosine-specific restriction endonuclease McrA
MNFIVIIIIFGGGLLLMQFMHMFNDWSYKHKLETDPKFKLLEETKSYMNCFTKYEPNIWLDSKSNGNFIFFDYDIVQSKEKIKYQGSLDDNFIKKLITAKNYNGYELKKCRECGALEFELKYQSKWDGFCSRGKCRGRCYERNIRHVKRSNNVINESSHLFNTSWENIEDRCKGCYDMIKYKERHMSKQEVIEKQDLRCAICKGKIDYSEEDIIPMYEFAEKQKFLCAICNGKMNHVWNERGDNYLYHTIDHIQPISLEGKHKKQNIQIVHFICNIVKGVGDNINLYETAEKILETNRELLYNEEELIKEFRKYIKQML